MKKYSLFISLWLSMGLAAAINTALTNSTTTQRPISSRAGNCVRGRAETDLYINNVRAHLLNSGDLWWNRTVARYGVPALSPDQIANGQRQVSPLYAGSIWISGKVGGNLRMAALRYSQESFQFWPGAIPQGASSINKTQCDKFDKFWVVNGDEINDAKLGKYSDNILNWPGRGNPELIKKGVFTSEDLNEPLAPFYDNDDDGIYNPKEGDLPSIKTVSSNSIFSGKENNKFTYADQMIFWVINDVGNDHISPTSTPIGVQMNCLAFAFQTGDAVNDMTFYTYEVWNKSNVTLNETYMSQYMDADLGNPNDDYVGCDTVRSLGFIYNNDDNDETTSAIGYQDQPPIFGADFFEGPKKANGQQIGMSSFIYYINGQGGQLNDPTTEIQYRNFQEGKTAFGLPLTVSPDCITQGQPTTKYCYYGDPFKSSEWSMCSANQPKSRDLRWVQNSGPFDMISGTAETITIGLVFVRPPKGSQTGCKPKMSDIQDADDKAQRLFEFQFESIPGPDAPDLSIIESSNRLEFELSNPLGSNNFGENYNFKNLNIESNVDDSTYKFEGYLIYQIYNESAVKSANDLKDNSKAKLLMVMDKKNRVEGKIVNLKESVSANGTTIVNIVDEIDLPNSGIQKSFVVDKDLFEFERQSRLVNNKTYYYAVVAFAYNNYVTKTTPVKKQKTQIIYSKNTKIFKATPHDKDFWGMQPRTVFGQGIDVKRIEGQGHGQYFLKIDSLDEKEIVSSYSKQVVKYLGGYSPIDVKVTDPYSVRDVSFKLTIVDTSSSTSSDKFDLKKSYWTLDIKDKATNTTQTIYSEGDLDREYSQSIFATIDNKLTNFGISVGQTVANIIDTVRRNKNPYYGYIGGSISYQDSSKKWLRLLSDNNDIAQEDWIRTGSKIDDKGQYSSAFNIINNKKVFSDSLKAFENVLSKTIAPYCLASNVNLTANVPENNYQSFSPGFKWKRVSTDSATMVNFGEAPENNLDSIFSFDLVITNDKSKWSRAVVFETGESPIFNEGGAMKGQIRQSPSVDKDGNPVDGIGLGYFPGYLINLETGVRMNVYFGENSRFRGKNAANMVWDPDSSLKTVLGNPIVGGSQFIYMMNTPYSDASAADDRDFLVANFNRTTGTGVNQLLDPNVAMFYRKIAWTCVPLMASGYSGLYNASGNYEIPTDVRIQIRVEKPYARYSAMESVYEFSTEGMQSVEVDSLRKNAMDRAMIVPNPYYAYSAYEIDAAQNIVKIINVPKDSKVSIYTTDGMLVRKFQLEEESIRGNIGSNNSEINYDNSITWDLRTTTGVLISSGTYYVNIESPELGNKILKLFAVMRSADVSNF